MRPALCQTADTNCVALDTFCLSQGGYNVEAIAESALGVTKAILGDAPPPFPAGISCGQIAAETIYQVAKVQQKHWKCIVPSGLEPQVEDQSLPTIQLPELLRAHRTYDLWEKYQLCEVPLLQHEDWLGGQVLCTSDIFASKTIVLFAHDMGNLRAERPTLDTDAGREKSYIIDSSTRVVDWALARGHGLIDINLFAQLPVKAQSQSSSRPGKLVADRSNEQREAIKQLMLYIWDNFVDLTDAERIVFIGHGHGCEALMHIIADRDVQSKVKAVVQVLGQNLIPLVPKDRPDLRKWYYSSSKVICPRDHPLYAWNEQERSGRRLGKTEQSCEYASRSPGQQDGRQKFHFSHRALFLCFPPLQTDSRSSPDPRAHEIAGQYHCIHRCQSGQRFPKLALRQLGRSSNQWRVWEPRRIK